MAGKARPRLSFVFPGPFASLPLRLPIPLPFPFSPPLPPPLLVKFQLVGLSGQVTL
ncbi:hypothetical protein M2169_006483 [Streptomyces sp. MJP52]|nr:hypothetical protein [Streptomyces sp. MJP52]